MKVPSIASTHDVAAKAVPSAATATNQLRGHRHSHGGHTHAHSHGSIEKSVSGRFLRQCQMATLAGGATNVFFCVTKLWIGSAGGSVALVADGFHSLTDILADIIAYGAISLSQKKFPRCRFPFGVGRLETSGAVLVAAILFFGGVALLVRSVEQCVIDVAHLLAAAPTGGVAAAVALRVRNALAAATGSTTATTAAHTGSEDDGSSHGHSHSGTGNIESAAAGMDTHGHSHAGDGHNGHSHFEVTHYDEATGKQVILWTMVGIAAASVVAKELLFRWTRRVGLRAGSRVVVANAYHHRADAWSGGVALVGVAGQLVGIPGIDGLAGLVVSLSICKIGYGLFCDAVLEFFDYQNAREVSSLREQLQEFSLRIEHGKRVVPAKTVAKTSNGASTGAVQTLLSQSASSSASVSSVASDDDPDAVDQKKILFMNVFLVRHGHKSALHVTLLVYETVQATQIREATDMLTALARGSVPVQDTFTTILVCSNHTEPREEYLGSDKSEEEVEEMHNGGDATAAATADTEKAHGHSHGKEETKNGKAAAEAHTAATGNIINPSLERCIMSLEEFHTFTSPIRYCWESRTITVPPSDSCECDRDLASLAEMFRCRLINEGAARNGEAEGKHSCGHEHSHDEHAHDSH